MSRIAGCLIVAALVSGQVLASEREEVLAALAHADDDYNRLDHQRILSSCSDVTSIIDDFPPHVWLGPDTCAKWLQDTEAFNKATGVSQFHEVLGKAMHVDITGDVAYVVMPARFTYTANGKKTALNDCRWTVVLRKGSGGWRMTSWAFSDGLEVAVKTKAAK